MIKILFNCIEVFAFILPALPNLFIVRLLILIIYFIAHYFKLQYVYKKIKNKYLRA